MNEPGKTDTIKSVVMSLRVLETVNSYSEARVTDVSETLEIPTSTAHKHLATLTSAGYLFKEGAKYKMSPMCVKLIEGLELESKLFNFSQLYVGELAQSTGEVVGVAISCQSRCLDIARVFGEHAIHDDDLWTPRIRKMDKDASGKAILSEMSDEKLESYFNTGSLLIETESELENLRSEIRQIRTKRIALERVRENGQGGNSVAVSLDLDDQPACIYVRGSSSRLIGKWFEEDIPGILSSAADNVRRGVESN